MLMPAKHFTTPLHETPCCFESHLSHLHHITECKSKWRPLGPGLMEGLVPDALVLCCTGALHANFRIFLTPSAESPGLARVSGTAALSATEGCPRD